MQEKSHALTLLELIFSIIILFFIVLSVVSIETFVRGQTYEADLRAQLQNENLVVLEHISKQAFMAIGNEFLYGSDSAATAGFDATDNSIVLRVYIDGDRDGVRDPGSPDHWIAYRWYSKAAPSNRFRVRYCSRCNNANCPPAQCPGGYEVISGMSSDRTKRRIANLDLAVNKDASGRLIENYLFANITACKDPQNIDLSVNPSGTTQNPCVNMQSRILLPSVTTN
jgi:hypothetical protein